MDETNKCAMDVDVGDGGDNVSGESIKSGTLNFPNVRQVVSSYTLLVCL